MVYAKYDEVTGVRTLEIWNPGQPEKALEVFRKLVRNSMVGDIDVAVLCYKGLATREDPNKPEQYALKFMGDKSAIWLSGVTAGYDGTGPKCAIEALRLMGFEVEENAIFTLTNGEELRWYK